VFVADENRRYVAVNRAACRLVGYSREEVLSMRTSDLVPPGPQCVSWDDMVERGSISGTAELLHRDGTRIPFAYVAGQTTVAGLAVYVSVGAPA
jgi:PAS domain S-box-containing protein